MSFLDLMQSRYTTKKYDASQKISNEKIEELKQVLQLSPSSINSQPWKFTIISNEEIKVRLAKSSYFNESRITDASHLVVFSVFNKVELFEKQIQENLPEGAVGYYDNFLKPLGENAIKSWMGHQVYLSLGIFLSACASMKIDSTPMEGIIPIEYSEILGEKDYDPLFAVAIGYRDQKDNNQPSKTAKERLEIATVIEEV